MYQLHEKTLRLVNEERRLTGLVIENLQKISDQKLYLKMAYSSLFEYCTKAPEWSPGRNRSYQTDLRWWRNGA